MSNMAYLSELFADSLLTGVPEITMTKSIPRKIFKIIVLFACIGGFIYQAAEFLGIFFEYPTNVDVGMAFQRGWTLQPLPSATRTVKLSLLFLFDGMRFGRRYHQKTIPVERTAEVVEKK
ncbi:hypothetical protein LAZ67_22000057 [Cordylochernes scorpioides]|uniref:Uncharacterized protein n=1 Tax=Cordylochernes scorpioides TaxID=51811 RepID=A0ABY6LQJ9_9ARAC|nr:hypothetical protein LAZ67_22000057 [Cordylochernes scorpioides]